MANASHELRSLAHKLLNDSECAELKSAIQGFRKSKSVLMLCASLYKILTTPEKMQILFAIYPMIHEDMRTDFDCLCSLQFDYYATTLRPKIIEKYGTKNSKRGYHTHNIAKEKATVLFSIEQLRRFHTPRDKSSKQDVFRLDEITASKTTRKSKEPWHKTMKGSPEQSPRNATQQQRKRSKTAHAVLGAAKIHSSRLSHTNQHKVPIPRVPPLDLDTSQNSSSNSMNSSQSIEQTPKNITVRKVKLERRERESLGFAIRGGTDLNCGIYVSEVDAGGQAERKGLRIGERILKVNDTTFKNVSHAEAVAALKASCRLIIYVAPIGCMPRATLNSTPRDIRTDCSENRKDSLIRSKKCSPLVSASNCDLKKITINADKDNWLGCSIRGGIDRDIDVTVANVDPGSPAYKAGLKKGQHIVKVNGVTVDTLSHVQVIGLITASSVVVFEVKAGSIKKSQSRHRQKLANDCCLKTSQDPIIAAVSQSPLNQSGDACSRPSSQNNWDDFDKVLMSTPPVSSSTPLPHDSHPMIVANRQTSDMDDATIIHLLQNGQESQSQDNDPYKIELDGAQDVNTVDYQCYSKYQQNKFDKGTIKLNMAEQGQKDILKTAKIIDISVAKTATTKIDRRRSHVKDIFAAKQAPLVKSVRSESCRSHVRCPKTPQRDRSNSMNILSTPYSNKQIEQIQITPPQNQLHDARRTANIQIQQELTGKRLLLSPNVPLTPSSPVATFLRKVLHTENGGAKNLKKNSASLESLGTAEISRRGSAGEKFNMPRISKWRSAYDFVTKGDSDDD